MYKFIYGALLLVAIGTSFWVVYDQGLSSHSTSDNIFERPMDHEAFNNIKEKCGVLETNFINTTSLRKISDCLDRIEMDGYNEGINGNLYRAKVIK